MKRKYRRILAILRLVVMFFFVQSILCVIVFRFVPIPVTPLMLIRVAEQLSAGKKVKLKKDWVAIEDISPKLIQAVVASEDQHFKDHWGFDFDAISKAVKNNTKKSRKTVKGGSTISQQVAKNVFLWPARSWVRKGFEVYFTILIEVFWSKERIMEVYLNVIEMGDGIYGAEVAARTYYSIPAKKMSQMQAASIAAILPNPREWSPVRSSPYVTRRKSWIARNMRNIGLVVFD